MDTSIPQKFYGEFLEGIQDSLKQMGFSLNKKEAVASRREQSWEHAIYFDPIWSPWGVRIDPHFWFREDHIQRIWGEFNDYIKCSDSSTLVIKLWYMCKMTSTNSEIFDISIEDHTSLTIYSQHFIKFMDDLGWEIINRLNSLNDYDTFINHTNPMNDEFQNRVFHRRYASPGLIAAKLNHNPQYEFLYEKYLDILIGFNNVDAQAELKALKAYMDAHSVEELLSL